MSDFNFESLMAGENLINAGASFGLTTSVRKSFKDFFATNLGQRLLPLMPIALSVTGALAGICEGVGTWQEKAGLGVLIGFVCGHVFKLGKTTVMGAGLPAKKVQQPSNSEGE